MAKSSNIDGHLRLNEQSGAARRRLITSGVVALVMMASGVALVAGLKPADKAQDAEVAASDEDLAPDTAKAQPAEANLADGKPDDARPADAKIAEADPAEVKPPEVAPDAAEADEPPADPTANDGGAPSDGGDDALAAKEADAPTTGEGEEPASAGQGAEGQWWMGIHGKRCSLAFGEHKRLIMREGKLNKDESTTYGPFANGPVAARVREELNPEVTVHHIGLHPRNQRPSLAFVTLHQQGTDTIGILPLQISGDQITLTPVSGKAPRR